MSALVNVSQVQQLSPFRYPGGKTWFVPYAMRWIEDLPTRPRRLLEPFAGGAMISLSALAHDRVDTVELWELDKGVASVWMTIFHGGAEELAEQVRAYTFDVEHVTATLASLPADLLGEALQTIIRNRAQRGGVLAAGAGLTKNGDGRGIASRWYPETLARRIEKLQAFRGRVEVFNGDGLARMRALAADPYTTTFADPPYTAGGKRAGARLYTHHQLDHAELFRAAEEMTGAVLMTYDDNAEVRELARLHGMSIEQVAMKTGHNAFAKELAIVKRGR